MTRDGILEVIDLHVNVADREVLKDINLSVEKEEIHVLMGPNASGKTTLVLTIMGYPNYKITGGRVNFDGEDLAGKDVSERARLGIGLAYQNSPDIRGVKLRDLLRFIAGEEPWNPVKQNEDKIASRYLREVGLNPESFLSRDVNLGFSGGERKRSELAQVFAMKPRLMILDEPDSGVDIDSLKLIGQEIVRVVSKLGCSVLIITHHRHILDYLKSDVAHIIYDGRIISSGEPDVIIPKIEAVGYEGYAKSIGG